MSTPAITVENLSKAYRIGLRDEIPDTLVGAVTSWVSTPARNFRRLRSLNTFSANGDQPDQDDMIWALRNVSFEVAHGEVLGIIGRNGAGKSTLLKIVSRITDPTAGRAVIRGRVSSLLEVGTGFHPELSGRENIYMNGTILGMRKKEIDGRLDEIIDFSGVEKFLDTPIKRYSSGMKVRLAFSVAAHLEPEILIIDEVLAVGDVEFQKKCLGKMEDVAGGGRTVLFVSHNLDAVQRISKRALLLKDGAAVLDARTSTVIDRHVNDGRDSATCIYVRSDDVTGEAFLQRAAVTDVAGQPVQSITFGAPFAIESEWYVKDTRRMASLDAVIRLFDHRGRLLTALNSRDRIRLSSSKDGICRLRCAISANVLMPGTYTADLAIYRKSEGDIARQEGCLSFEVLELPVRNDNSFNITSKAMFALDATWSA